MVKFFHDGDTVGASGGAAVSVITNFGSGWSKQRDSVPL